MSSTESNVGGWLESKLYTYVKNDLWNLFPIVLKSIVIDTTVVSSHGSNDSINFESTDKLYLLATAEIWAQGSSNIISTDSTRESTRQLDYYNKNGATTNNYSATIKKQGTNAARWWLRSAYSSDGSTFFSVNSNGDWDYLSAITTFGVSPAFGVG